MAIVLRLVVCSDLHIDINTKRKSRAFTEKLVEYLQNLDGDILLVTGDISGRNQDLRSFFQLSKTIETKYKFFVPGNHDIWVNRKSDNLSWYKLKTYLPNITAENGWHFLPSNPIIIPGTDIGFAGAMGWYDYSLRNKIWDSEIGKDKYERKINPVNDMMWVDKLFANFGELSDQELTGVEINNLSKDIEYILSSGGVTELVVATHFVPYRELVRYRGLLEYDYFTAFFGSENLGKAISEFASAVQHITTICGHHHVPSNTEIGSNISAYCVPIGYPREYGVKSLEKVFSERILLIEL